MPQLPAEVLSCIFSFLPQRTKKDCRLLNRSLLPTATAHTFRNLRLEACNSRSPLCFKQIAQQPHLRIHVREITVDTWIGPQFKYSSNSNYEWPYDLFSALPHLRFYPNVTSLDVRFNQHCGHDERSIYAVAIEETYDFRLQILRTVLNCVAGDWTYQRAETWDAVVDRLLENDEVGGYESECEEGGLSLEANDFDPGITTPMPLRTLIITNLADYNDPRLRKMKNFEKVIRLRSLTELKLLITVEREEHSPENSIHFREKYDFFDTIGTSWLAPAVCHKLEVLSLFCRDYWGWAPRCDFRKLNPGNGPTDVTAGLPNLRVLALGNFVFTHDWQIDWFTSLGVLNRSGGLEELYLDDCPIMWHATYEGPLDTGVQVIGTDHQGNDLTISNEGYPREDILTQTQSIETQWDEEMDWSKRWSDVLNVWRTKMRGLKVFRMGSGSWHGEHAYLIAQANETSDVDLSWKSQGSLGNSRRIMGPSDERYLGQRSRHVYNDQVHIAYDCPEPPRSNGYESWYFAVEGSENLFKEQEVLVAQPVEQILPRIKNGVGLSQQRKHILQYTTFDIGIGPTQWTGDDFNPTNHDWRQGDAAPPQKIEVEQYEAILKRDEQALSSLLTTVNNRRLGRI